MPDSFVKKISQKKETQTIDKAVLKLYNSKWYNFVNSTFDVFSVYC